MILNIVNGTIIGLFALAALVLAVLLVTTIGGNFRTGRDFRAGLARRLTDLRLSRMAAAVGVDVNRCLHDQMVVDLEQGMRNCRSCGETERCDEVLAQPAIQVEDVEFCPNQPCLSRYAVEADRA